MARRCSRRGWWDFGRRCADRAAGPVSALPWVTHIIAPSPAGGAESVVLALASARAHRTSAIIIDQVAHAGDPPHPLAAALRDAGVRVDEVRCGRRQYRAEVREITRILQARGAAIAHTHGYHGTIAGSFAARRAGVASVATVHGYLTRNAKERLYNWIDRRLLRRFDAVIAVSREIRDQLLASGVADSRISMVQNGLAPSGTRLDRSEARSELGLPAKGFVVGWIGRLSPEKGPDLFVRTLAVARTKASLSAVIIGDGPERPALEELARSIGAPVVFAGQRNTAASFLPALDMLALSSRTEGTPMVLLEAIAARVPIAAFRVGGVPDLLSQDSAWLASPGDVEALGAGISEAATAPEERKTRADRALERLSDRLSLGRWGARVEDVYGQALARTA